MTFKVYDKVWIMQNDRPKEMLVFAVVESMGYFKRGTEVHYQLVESMMGAGWGNNEGIRRDEEGMFSTKEELVNSL